MGLLHSSALPGSVSAASWGFCSHVSFLQVWKLSRTSWQTVAPHGAGQHLTHAHSPPSTPSPPTPRHPRDRRQPPRTFPGRWQWRPHSPVLWRALQSRTKPGPWEKERDRAVLSSDSRSQSDGGNYNAHKENTCVDIGELDGDTKSMSLNLSWNSEGCTKLPK